MLKTSIPQDIQIGNREFNTTELMGTIWAEKRAKEENFLEKQAKHRAWKSEILEIRECVCYFDMFWAIPTKFHVSMLLVSNPALFVPFSPCDSPTSHYLLFVSKRRTQTHKMVKKMSANHSHTRNQTRKGQSKMPNSDTDTDAADPPVKKKFVLWKRKIKKKKKIMGLIFSFSKVEKNWIKKNQWLDWRDV